MYEVFMNNPEGDGRALHYYVYDENDDKDIELSNKLDKNSCIILSEFIKKFESMIKHIRKTLKNKEYIYGGTWADNFAFTIKNYESENKKFVRPKTIKKEQPKELNLLEMI